MESEKTAATCTEGGYTLETCKNCGDTKKTNETEAVGHDDGEWKMTAEAQLGVAGSRELRSQTISWDTLR